MNYYPGGDFDRDLPLPPWSQSNQTPWTALKWMAMWLLNAEPTATEGEGMGMSEELDERYLAAAG